MAVSTRAEERARILSLIDFLADYDARRNPPVYDIQRYDLFLLRDADLPEVPGYLSAAEAWLTVDFLDLPPRPEIPEELVALLGESAAVSPHVWPEVRTASDGIRQDEHGTGSGPGLVSAAGQWITREWEPFASRWAEVTGAKTLHRALFQQRELLATDREAPPSRPAARKRRPSPWTPSIARG